MKNNIADKYFQQKSWSFLEVVCVVAIVIAVIVATVVTGGIPIGIPIIAVAAVTLIFIKSSKVTDSEIDSELDKLISNYIDTTNNNSVIKTFNFKQKTIIRGKDEKLRSPIYVISEYNFRNSNLEIVVYSFNLITKNVEKKEYKIPPIEKITLLEKKVVIPGGQKTLYYLNCNMFEEEIPVNIDDIDSFKIIEKVCDNEKL